MKKESLKRKITLNKKVVLLLNENFKTQIIGGALLNAQSIILTCSTKPCDNRTLLTICNCPKTKD